MFTNHNESAQPIMGSAIYLNGLSTECFMASLHCSAALCLDE